MKAYTDIEQSKKLAEILPIESADMSYIPTDDDERGDTLYTAEIKSEIILSNDDEYIPCWSLAALLNVLPSVIKRDGKRMFLTLDKVGAYNLYYTSLDKQEELWETKEQLVDACYEMILKLHENNIL